MAKRVKERTFGIDVAKRWLDIYDVEDDQAFRIDNDAVSIEAWLSEVSAPARLSVEATNQFHEELIARAHAQGHCVYIVDALRLSRYREAVGGRAKTDQQDAVLLARYLQQEQQQLRRWAPPDPCQTRHWRLLKRRATLVKTTTRLRQSLVDLGTLDAAAEDLLRHCQRLIRRTERELQVLARQLGWNSDVWYGRSIPGIGPVTSLALVAAFHRCDFHSADAFIAFMGLDVRVRDSGTFRGRRKLTKKGEPELRRLLYNAAMAACRQPCWKPYYQSLRDRGFSGTQALVALSRKLARVCYALLKQQTAFDPARQPAACVAT